METRFSYTIVGIFVVGLSIAMVFIILWLTVGFQHKSYRTYLVYVTESVASLAEDANVRYNGVKVGYISSIRLNLKDPEQVILTLQIESEIPITENTRAVLMEQGITGVGYLGLKGGADAPLLKTQPGQPYPIIKNAPSFNVRLDTTITQLSNNINKVSDSINAILNKENQHNLQQILNNINQFSQMLSKNKQNFANMLENLSAGGKGISHLSETGNMLLQEFSGQVMPELYDVLENFNTFTMHFDELTKDVKRDPSIVLYGKSPRAKGPGE